MTLLLTTLISISCSPTSDPNTPENQYTLGDRLLVQSISYTRTEGNNTIRKQDDYAYEDERIITRVETNLDSNDTKTFTYTYSDDLLSSVQIYNGQDDSESEIKMYYNENNQVYSYDYTTNLNTNSSTYSLATFSYEGNQILHCDDKTWSSVEYKDVYDGVFVYTTNESGDVIEIDEVEDCYFSAPSIDGGLDVSLEYDDNPSPFMNITGNNAILNMIISPFTGSRANGFSHNATSQTADPSQNTETWHYEYNNAGYPMTIQWQLDDNREDVEIVYY